MGVSVVSIVSLLCALLQLVYICTILWLLRVRRQRLQASAAQLPALPQPNDASQKHQHTVTQAGYYSNFLPSSFHSVLDPSPLTCAESSGADFSYQTNHTPLSGGAGGHLSASLGPGSNGLPVHPDMGKLSFSASLIDRGHGAGANLYDADEDNFAAQNENKEEHSEPAISPIKPQSMSSNYSAHSQHSQGRLESLAEDDAAEQQADVVVMPASVGAGLFLSQHIADDDEEEDDMTVSLDGDEPIARNVELIVDGNPEAKRPRADIQLEKSRSPVIRSTNPLSGGSKAASYQAETLHVSAAPFSLPSHASRVSRGAAAAAASSVNDNYSALSGGDEESPLQPSSGLPHRAQSRLIPHPKSASYRGEGGGFLTTQEKTNWGAGAGGGEGTGRQRRTSLQRRMAAAKAASFNNGVVSSTGSSSSNMAIPHSSTAPSNPTGRNAHMILPPLDPHASPVRTKVKFADSPRDRSAAEQMRKSMRQQKGDTEGQTGEEAANGAPAAQPNQLVPRERTLPKPLLKHRSPPAPLPSGPSPSSSSSSSSAPLLVLPIYYRFLVLQLSNCAAWTLAGFVLVACGTNLVQWGTNQNQNSTNSSEPGHPLPTNPNGDSHAWWFGLIMGILMAMNACVMDGLLIFLASKHVGRAAIKFAYTFGLVWGAINGLAVIVVTQAVPRNNGNSDPSGTGNGGHLSSGLLPLSHPFFTRSCLALLLNLVVLILPQACFCGARARRTNTCCVRSREEKILALQRQQARWDARQELLANQQSIHTISSATASIIGREDPSLMEEEDSFDEDDYVTDDVVGLARTTWFRYGLINLAFHSLVILLYILDFTQSSRSAAAEPSNTWSTLLLVLFVLAFIFSTPLLYYCLRRDSAHWAAEWKGVLERMKAEAEAEEQLRKQERQAEEQRAKKEGREPLPSLLPPSRPNPYASFHTAGGGEGKMSSFFLEYSLLEYGPMLGSGGFSSVYSARLGRYDVAVKVLHVRDLTKEVIEQFLHEVGIVLQLQHPNVVQFLGIVFAPPDMSLVMERCRRQSLLHLIKHQKVKFTEFQAVSIGLAIADGLRYIHERDILHRDLKAANILFDQAGRPKVCDFGLSEERSKIDLTRVFCGTLAYMSPEVLRSETVGKPSDVYSWSIIMWELLHNELAWKRGSHQKHGLNARVLVEMVAYRRARPPVKERPVDDRKGGGTPPNSVNVQPPLPPDSARIHPQAFGPDVAAPSPTNSTSHSSSTVAAPSSSSSSRPGIHPALVQLLRECWRDDYRRRPSFAEIVKRLSAFREMIRAQLQR